jgi:hypothetical protein
VWLVMMVAVVVVIPSSVGIAQSMLVLLTQHGTHGRGWRVFAVGGADCSHRRRTLRALGLLQPAWSGHGAIMAR